MGITQTLKSNVDFLGTALGKTLMLAEGEQFLEKIETIRHMAKLSRSGETDSYEELVSVAEAYAG